MGRVIMLVQIQTFLSWGLRWRESLLNPGPYQRFLCKGVPGKGYRGVCVSQQLMPRPVQWSGTIRKYLSMASQNRARYSSGETTVGIFPEDIAQHRSIRSTLDFSLLHCVCDCRSQKGHLQTLSAVNCWLPTMLQLVIPESIKTRKTVSNKQRQSVRVWISQNHIYNKKKNVQTRSVARPLASLILKITAL